MVLSTTLCAASPRAALCNSSKKPGIWQAGRVCAEALPLSHVQTRLRLTYECAGPWRVRKVERACVWAWEGAGSKADTNV